MRGEAEVEYLREHGPVSMADYPHESTSVEARMLGVWKFHPRGRYSGSSSGNTAGKLNPVYYLKGEHTPHEIVEAWLEANEYNVENGKRRSIFYRLKATGEEFDEAVSDLFPLHPEVEGGD